MPIREQRFEHHPTEKQHEERRMRETINLLYHKPDRVVSMGKEKEEGKGSNVHHQKKRTEKKRKRRICFLPR